MGDFSIDELMKSIYSAAEDAKGSDHPEYVKAI